MRCKCVYRCRPMSTFQVGPSCAKCLAQIHLCSQWMHWRRSAPTTHVTKQRVLPTVVDLRSNKSAHTALAVKACLLGGNSNTKCSMTFVNIAVAISALAGGGGAQKRFRTETRIRWCFRHFSRIFGCLSARGYWNGILGSFWVAFRQWKNGQKWKKHCT